MFVHTISSLGEYWISTEQNLLLRTWSNTIVSSSSVWLGYEGTHKYIFIPTLSPCQKSDSARTQEKPKSHSYFPMLLQILFSFSITWVLLLFVSISLTYSFLPPWLTQELLDSPWIIIGNLHLSSFYLLLGFKFQMFLMTQTLSKLNIKPMCLYVIQFLKVKKKTAVESLEAKLLSVAALSCPSGLP